MMKTYAVKPDDIKREWHVIDADGQILGRLASLIAQILRGKHKVIFSRNADTGDHVIVINAEKIRVSGNKLAAKLYKHHTGYPGGLKTETLADALRRHPERVIERAVKGMLPHNALGDQTRSKLKIYAGPTHPHAAQKPTEMNLARD